MKKNRLRALLWGSLALVALLLVQCGDDDKKPSCADGLQNQNETGTDCGGPCPVCVDASDGTWTSFPVAPLLQGFADSIGAQFNANDTYTLTYWLDGDSTQFTGTCVRTASGVGELFTIQLDQKYPSVAKWSGIYQIKENDRRMTLEIIQTTPSINATPPSALDGFGSSKFNGVALGPKNVQEFYK